jgi:hypothetical protein
MGWPDSVSSPFPLPANGEELHHLQQQQKTHKQPIYIFDLFVFFKSVSFFFLLFVKSASPTDRYVICFFFFFSSASGARSGGAAGGW